MYVKCKIIFLLEITINMLTKYSLDTQITVKMLTKQTNNLFISVFDVVR